MWHIMTIIHSYYRLIRQRQHQIAHIYKYAHIRVRVSSFHSLTTVWRNRKKVTMIIFFLSKWIWRDGFHSKYTVKQCNRFRTYFESHGLFFFIPSARKNALRGYCSAAHLVRLEAFLTTRGHNSQETTYTYTTALITAILLALHFFPFVRVFSVCMRFLHFSLCSFYRPCCLK